MPSSPPSSSRDLRLISLSDLDKIFGIQRDVIPGSVYIVEEPKEETRSVEKPRAQTWRKVDLVVLPILSMMCFLSFLDRINVGSARAAGMQRDLQMSDLQYTTALTVTFIPYILCEIPSNLMLQALGAKYVLPGMITMWGVVALSTGFVKTYRTFIASRFFLGLFEGGLYPGVCLYLTYFYPRHKISFRLSLILAPAALCGAFSGLLAFGIAQMSGVSNIRGWGWIFILEGLFTVIFGLLSFRLLPRSVETMPLLDDKEKESVIQVLKNDSRNITETRVSACREIINTFGGLHVWFGAGMAFALGTKLMGMFYITPAIVRSLGYNTEVKAQLMSVPPYAAGLLVTLVIGYLSDRLQQRGFMTIISNALCAIGFAVFLASTSDTVRYGSIFLMASGSYPSPVIVTAWMSNNSFPEARRATAIALQSMMASLGALLSVWLFGYLSPAPEHVAGTITLLALSGLEATLAGVNTIYLRKQNEKKVIARQFVELGDNKGINGHGDDSAWFVYTL
ncbi:mfs transporter [Moniliophthora roreri MCA 2997]|uniref:Mfs transporter n=1 Tax=Moniliophthora roreri (strain MCA 2997) TaxID=1381753 RepID=V2X5K6_MONRO|nr:mfs transporter [Moniliophthora roreri MCA 2997]KAI3595099.1 mfs transporter [Moniliophthora roreri]